MNWIHHQLRPWITRCIVMLPTLTMMNTLSVYVRNARKTNMSFVIGSHELSTEIRKQNRSLVKHVMTQKETILTCTTINVPMWFDWNRAMVMFVSHWCNLRGRRLRTNINPTNISCCFIEDLKARVPEPQTLHPQDRGVRHQIRNP